MSQKFAVQNVGIHNLCIENKDYRDVVTEISITVNYLDHDDEVDEESAKITK